MLQYRFKINQLKGVDVRILSLFEDKLLVGSTEENELFIVSIEGRLILNFKTEHKLVDAKWTPKGNIVCSIDGNNDVLVISEHGKPISMYSEIGEPRSLSVSNEGIIFLGDYSNCLYESKDGGFSWNYAFENLDERYRWIPQTGIADRSKCFQAIKITTNEINQFWILETSDENSAFLRVYSLDRKRTNKIFSWREFNIILSTNSKLSYDGNMKIFVSDTLTTNVSIISVNSHHECFQLSTIQTTSCSHGLTFDRNHQLLFVGQEDGLIEVFKMTN